MKVGYSITFPHMLINLILLKLTEIINLIYLAVYLKANKIIKINLNL